MDIVRTAPKRRKAPILWAAAALVAVIATIAAASLDPAVPTVDRATVLIDSVRRGDVVRDVRGPGSLVPERIRFVTALASARVERLNAESGQEVAAGDVLLALSNPDLQIQTLQAEQAVRQARIELLNLKTDLRSAILTQEGTVASMRTQFLSARQEAAVADSLARRSLISVVDARNREASVEEFTTRLRVEEERLALMRQAIDSQIAVQASQVAQLEAIADNQRQRLASLTVRAPEAGVLQELTLQLGQWVPEGTTLAKVVQPGSLKAVLRIPESQAKDVQVGQPATVDTRNGIVEGRVARKDPSAQSGSVIIDVAMTGPLPAGAVPDLSVDGTIRVDRMDGVLHTGRPASAAGSGTISLFRLEPDGEHAVRVPVQVGRTAVNVVEILGGLAEGDRVIVSDLSQYATAQRIRLR